MRTFERKWHNRSPDVFLMNSNYICRFHRTESDTFSQLPPMLSDHLVKVHPGGSHRVIRHCWVVRFHSSAVITHTHTHTYPGTRMGILNPRNEHLFIYCDQYSEWWTMKKICSFYPHSTERSSTNGNFFVNSKPIPAYQGVLYCWE